MIVCGSRQHHGNGVSGRIAKRLAELPADTVIVHGDAKGVDRIAGCHAEKLGLPVEPHPARNYLSQSVGWMRAPLIRNEAMAAMGADLCLAFWNGHSTGTAHMMRQARRHGIPVEVIR